jgi:adenylosuccinate lyase
MPAQLVTVGKRACMWLVDLLMDLEELTRIHSSLKFLGTKGELVNDKAPMHDSMIVVFGAVAKNNVA